MKSNAKTGQCGIRTQKVSVLQCDGLMETLVGTMGQLDGIGEPEESNPNGEDRE